MKMNKIATALMLCAVTFVGASSAGSHDASLNKQEMKALKSVAAARSDEEKARDAFRNPVETLAFFGVKPGMTVAEALPGGGWYSKIIANYLGSEGQLYGVNYVDSMWARFGFFSEERIKERIAATHEFGDMVKEHTDNGIKTMGFTFNTVPDEVTGKVDRVLFIRALHNLNRFEKDANTMTEALQATHKMLKDDGLVGVVQHQLPESAADSGADGSRGYLKQSALVATFEKAGFELVASADINSNKKDQPSDTDIVWRLPPTYFGAGDDPEKREAADAIGESNRMTLLFKKR